MIKTINLTGSEVKVTELGGDNTEIFNNSGGIVYASKLQNITAGGDEVIAIPPGAIDGLYGTRGTVYLLGAGKVELRGVDHKITKTRGQSAEGGLEVVRDYIDLKNTETLDIAKTYADVKDSEVLVNVKEYTDSLNSELAGYIGYTDGDIYGLEADFENNIFTRLAGAVGKTAGPDFDSINAYGSRRRCNLSDSGEVLAYYGESSYKEDGSNGQVMVEQPKFYYRVVPIKTEKTKGEDGFCLRKARYYISDTPKAGFKVHPAFIRNGIEVDRIYLSAFEGCIYDSSAGVYLLEDEQIADFNNDKLSSIAGAKPCSGEIHNLNKANSGKLANNRGKGWGQLTIQALSAVQLLFIIEYASFNSQTALGSGVVNQPNAIKTGSTSSLGNTSGTVGAGGVSYRGEENIWGNIWKFVDGLNGFGVDGRYTRLYISDNDFSDVSDEKLFENSLPKYVRNAGYISAFGYSPESDWLFIAAESIGNSSLPVGDYSYSSTKIGQAYFVAGGAWYEKGNSGMFFITFGSTPSSHWASFGARLQYFPE